MFIFLISIWFLNHFENRFFLAKWLQPLIFLIAYTNFVCSRQLFTVCLEQKLKVFASFIIFFMVYSYLLYLSLPLLAFWLVMIRCLVLSHFWQLFTELFIYYMFLNSSQYRTKSGQQLPAQKNLKVSQGKIFLILLFHQVKIILFVCF